MVFAFSIWRMEDTMQYIGNIVWMNISRNYGSFHNHKYVHVHYINQLKIMYYYLYVCKRQLEVHYNKDLKILSYGDIKWKLLDHWVRRIFKNGDHLERRIFKKGDLLERGSSKMGIFWREGSEKRGIFYIEKLYSKKGRGYFREIIIS